MSRIHGLGYFNVRSSAQLYAPEPIAAIAIAGDSLCDEVKVNSRVLRVGQVMSVPPGASPLIEPSRSYRTGQGQTAADEVNAVVLETWARGEHARPSNRSPALAAFNGAWTSVPSARAARLPFQGRRMAQMGLTADGTPGINITWVVYGVRYRPRPLITAGTWTETAGYVQLGTGTYTTGTAGPAGGTDRVGTFNYAGGTDSAEDFDELELWLALASVGTVTVAAYLRGWGENGGGEG